MTAPPLVAEERRPFDRLAWQPRSRPLGWWGMVMFIATEAMLFAILLFGYWFIRAQAAEWPLGDVEEPELFKSGIRTILLLSSSVTMHVADVSLRRGRRGWFVAGVTTTFLMAAVFFAGHIEESHKMWIEDERPDTNAYTSAFWTVVNFHAFHLLVGMGMLVVAGVRGVMGRYDEGKHLGGQLTAMYWHFVDVVWVFVYSSLYLSVAWA